MEVRVIFAEELKLVVAEDVSIENLMLIKAALMDVQMGYDAYEFPVPEWVDEKYNEVNSEIELKLRAQLMRDIKRETAMQETYKTKVEKRKDSEDRVASMKKTLEKLEGK